jgi:hypothetical protein
MADTDNSRLDGAIMNAFGDSDVGADHDSLFGDDDEL